MGRLSWVNPQGTARAGTPARLKGPVKLRIPEIRAVNLGLGENGGEEPHPRIINAPV